VHRFDRDGNIWVGATRGLNRLNVQTGDQSIGGAMNVENVYEDWKGTLWIGTRRGLFVLNDDKLEYAQFYNPDGRVFEINK